MKMNYENTKKSIRLGKHLWKAPNGHLFSNAGGSLFTACSFLFSSQFFFYTQKNKKIKWKREPKLHRQNNKYETVVTGLV
jgi:hypothetical protein